MLYQHDNAGQVLEPVEEVTAEVDEEQYGTIIEQITARKGVLLDMTMHAGRVAGQATRARLTCRVSSRGMIGYSTVFQAETSGTGVINRRLLGYEPLDKSLDPASNRNGAIVSTSTGTTTAYALENIQARGRLFVGPREQVYEGMIIGAAPVHDN